ncbi:MAG: hypothetical protein JWQ31_2292 [Mycobacterium sp.]|jgi:hypothetical protein|nr:hypothetical protein [Mycobacterium sp.]
MIRVFQYLPRTAIHHQRTTVLSSTTATIGQTQPRYEWPVQGPGFDDARNQEQRMHNRYRRVVTATELLASVSD